MIGLSVKLDRANIARLRTLYGANRKMAAQSLTFTAERAQTAWRAGHGVFYRRNAWIDKGVRIKHATPGNLNARVGTIDKYMGRHVKGVDAPKAGKGKGLFVPTLPASEQPTHTRTRSTIRRMFSTKNKPFWRAGKLLRRIGRKSTAPLRVLAVMRSSVDITPRLDAKGITARAVNAHFPSVYERLLLKWAEGASQ